MCKTKLSFWLFLNFPFHWSDTIWAADQSGNVGGTGHEGTSLIIIQQLPIIGQICPSLLRRCWSRHAGCWGLQGERYSGVFISGLPVAGQFLHVMFLICSPNWQWPCLKSLPDAMKVALHDRMRRGVNKKNVIRLNILSGMAPPCEARRLRGGFCISAMRNQTQSDELLWRKSHLVFGKRIHTWKAPLRGDCTLYSVFCFSIVSILQLVIILSKQFM